MMIEFASIGDSGLKSARGQLEHVQWELNKICSKGNNTKAHDQGFYVDVSRPARAKKMQLMKTALCLNSQFTSQIKLTLCFVPCVPKYILQERLNICIYFTFVYLRVMFLLILLNHQLKHSALPGVCFALKIIPFFGFHPLYVGHKS